MEVLTLNISEPVVSVLIYGGGVSEIQGGEGNLIKDRSERVHKCSTTDTVQHYVTMLSLLCNFVLSMHVWNA